MIYFICDDFNLLPPPNIRFCLFIIYLSLSQEGTRDQDCTHTRNGHSLRITSRITTLIYINPTSPTHVLTLPRPQLRKGHRNTSARSTAAVNESRISVSWYGRLLHARKHSTHVRAYTRARTQVHEKEPRILASWWTIRTHARVCSHTHAHTLAQVENPDEDAVNPDEYEEFFSQFGQVAYVTVAKNNSNVLRRDQGFFPQGNTNLSRGNSRRKENRKRG